MSNILPKLINTDYTYNGLVYRLRYLGLHAGLPYFSYYFGDGSGIYARYLLHIPPPTIITAVANLLSNNANPNALILISQANADQMTFDFSEYVEPDWMVSDWGFDLNGTPICVTAPFSATNSLLCFSFHLVVRNSPVSLRIDVFIDHIAPDGEITHYRLTKGYDYEIQEKVEYIYSTDNYKVGTYNLINLLTTRLL